MDTTRRVPGGTQTDMMAGRERASQLLSPGTAVGNYRVEACCGRGGFGAVYRARDPAGELVAVKVLHPDLGGSTDVLRRFEQEASLLNRLSDPHIVRVLEVGELGTGQPFFAMEWVAGPMLASIRKQRGRLMLHEAAAVLGGLCAGLGRAHREGIVHRDIKGENVMLADDTDLTQVKLVDFGVAKLLEQGGPPGITRTGIRLGTPGYMAPEQILGLPVDGRADIYALGVLLFELVTGELPFTGAFRVEIEEKALNAPVPPASERAGVPAALDVVIGRSMAKYAAHRFQTTEDLLEAIECVAHGREPVSVALGADRPPAVEAQAADTGPIRVAVLYVAVIDEHAMSDEALDAADAVLEAMSRSAASAGLGRATHDASSLLFSSPLHSDPAARAESCRALRSFAGAQQGALPAELAPCFRLVLHVTLARTRTMTLRDGPHRLEDSLLVLDSRFADGLGPGLSETPEFVAELEGATSSTP